MTTQAQIKEMHEFIDSYVDASGTSVKILNYDAENESIEFRLEPWRGESETWWIQKKAGENKDWEVRKEISNGNAHYQSTDIEARTIFGAIRQLITE